MLDGLRIQAKTTYNLILGLRIFWRHANLLSSTMIATIIVNGRYV